MDAQFVYWDTDRTPMVMNNLCLFEGGPLHDEHGEFRIDEIRRAIAARVHLVPRYRRKLLKAPFGLVHPVLVDDPDFDITPHVTVERLPAPGTLAQLTEAYSRLHEGMLDHTRPLWEITFLTGLEDGRVGMVQKIHHAPFDGSSTVDIMDLLFHAGTDGEAQPEPPVWRPEAPPDALTLLGASVGRQASEWLARLDPRRLPQLPADLPR